MLEMWSCAALYSRINVLLAPFDHTEHLETPAPYKARGQWLLGELHDGHEFLITLPIRRTGIATNVFT